MTDPTPETTPTRDEAVPAGWRYSINHGPDGEENFANVYAADGQFVGNLRTHHAVAICNAFAVCEKLASAPAPASGGVAAVVAEELAIKIVLLSVNWLRDSASEKEHEDYVRANWTKEIAEAKRLILASLSPAATPVSEGDMRAFGASEHAAYKWPDDTPEHRAARAAFCEGAALAKPASSPAPVRPIGNQGISDYQREIARNMAEGFAAWNAARQEALPSDEPASSPAGVREALQKLYDGGVACHDLWFFKELKQIIAALSQSTSAGRGTDDAS